MLFIEGMRRCGFRKQYWISWKPLLSWLLTLDLVNFDGFRGFRGFRFLDPPVDLCGPDIYVNIDLFVNIVVNIVVLIF